jgi:hypothetical protein
MNSKRSGWIRILLLVATMGLLMGMILLGGPVSAQGGPSQDSPPIEQLPWCPESLYREPIKASELPPPDINAPDTCRLRTTIYRHPPGQPGRGPSMPAGGGRRGSGQPASNNPNYAWAANNFTCREPWTCAVNSPGFTDMYMNFSAQIPTLDPGESWNDHHLYNRLHVTHPSYLVNCYGYDQYQTVSAGIAKGWVLEAVFHNEIIAEKFVTDSGGNPVCDAIGSGIIVDPPGAIMFHAYRNGDEWRLRVWLGYWAVLADVWTSWGVAADAEGGQELWSADPNKLSAITVPVNFAHRMNIAGTSNSLRPWHDVVISDPLRGHTRVFADPPFHVMDLFWVDYTAMASSVNVP